MSQLQAVPPLGPFSPRTPVANQHHHEALLDPLRCLLARLSSAVHMTFQHFPVCLVSTLPVHDDPILPSPQ